MIAKGYADPEPLTVFYGGPLVFRFPTRFKFMIISAEDTSQTFLDNWDVSDLSDPFELKKGVWYEGDSVVSVNSVVANDQFRSRFGLRMDENMFYRPYRTYNILD